MRSDEQVNPHLNLFQFFNEDSSTQFIENNLSRALALCLKHDSCFLSKFIEAIATQADSKYVLDWLSTHLLDLDIQKKMRDVEVESFKTVYAVAITGDQELEIGEVAAKVTTANGGEAVGLDLGREPR